MPIKTPKELFVMLLTDLRQGTEKAERIYEEIGQLVQDSQIKQALQARAFVSGKVLATLDECFKLLGEQPAKLSGQLQETLIEDFRRELAEIQGPVARRLFALVKLNHVAQFRISEYRALIAAAGRWGRTSATERAGRRSVRGCVWLLADRTTPYAARPKG